MQQESDRILERLQIKVPSATTTVDKLSGGQRQAVAIGRAIAWGRHIVLLDEPAAALGVEQSRHVNELICRLRDAGVALILISHNMQSVLEVCDRAVVLRHGRKVADVAVRDVSASDLVALITGATRAA
jgi:simple sugar transport system ATP-binding protein